MSGFLGIKKFRKRMNMQANQMAKKLNVSNAAYSNWENGKRDPSFEIVQTLFKMGATVEELFGVKTEVNETLLSKTEFEKRVAEAVVKMIKNGEVALSAKGK